MTPLTPFMVLALVYVLRRIAGADAGETVQGLTPGRVFAGAVVVASVALFAFFWPVLIGEHISQAAWSMRIWFCRGGGSCLWNWV
jgi:dolichyl-phosphate-mannose-protein mannosyltransferase